MSLNRDRFLKATAGAVAGLAAGAGDISAGSAADESPLGTFPAGVGRDSVFLGLCCPLTGSYGADGEDLRTFYPPTVIGTLENGKPLTLMLGSVYYRGADHQLVRPVPVVVGKTAARMKNTADFFEVIDILPGEDVMAPLRETGCVMPPVT